ncbi:MBL fold metallo-hydrolase [Halioglobus maricola]|uniref:MBL fold metallo-hydrolase n=1 Tax=Halioglobus maricola TaxID=2601894 RepID=A0A5P9NHJ2_9GAMM|nr:MBL fold metallo-hydrolase [Halioglobus maricola]QFU75290.1 MBL fold metallo-hydrolase [Halioglobus maricola]
MTASLVAELGDGISSIDALYLRPGLVSFYLLEHNGECAVIDTGTVHSVPILESHLAARGIAAEQVRYIIPTHVHLDHAGGAGAMMQRFPDATLLVHPQGARHLIDPAKLIAGSIAVYGEELFAELYGDVIPVSAERVIAVEDGQSFSVGGRPLLFRHTPGHADHHFCVWDEQTRGWFAGDMFGICYREFRLPGGNFCMLSTTPTQFRPDAMRDSLRLLGAAQPKRIFLNHYGGIDYSDAQLATLLDQVDGYVDIAARCEGDATAMEEAIMDFSLATVLAQNPQLDPEAVREGFRFDAQLNAQGLAVWRARQ